MANKIKNLIAGLVICFCFISLVSASDEGLVAYYSFDEGEGNVLHDLSENGNDGTIYGAKWVDGKYGKALEFGGRDDYVDVLNSESFEPKDSITLEGWFKASPGDYRTIISAGYAYEGGGWNEGGWLVRLTRDSGPIMLHFRIRTTKGIDAVGKYNNVENNRWHHFTAVYDGSRIKLYIDGKLHDSKYLGGTIKYTGNSLRIGRLINQREFFKGTIDEIRIYNRALTEDEIKSHMLPPTEMMKKIINDTISKTQTKIIQLKKENINTETIEKIITLAENALQKEAYQTALELAQDASSKADEIWNAFQNYNTIKKEVEVKIDQLKREGIDTAIIEKTLSEAENAFENEDIDLAQQLVSDAESKTDEAWNTYQDIKIAKKSVNESKEIDCDALDAESKISDAIDALNKGSYDFAKQYAEDADSLAKKANCGKISIDDLKALAVKYNGKTVEISGKVRDIETDYGRGYKFAVDDGTGLIIVRYEGSMKDIDDGDEATIVGVFSKSSGAISAEKVEKAGIDILPGDDSRRVLILILISIIVIGALLLILYFKVIKK